MLCELAVTVNRVGAAASHRTTLPMAALVRLFSPLLTRPATFVLSQIGCTCFVASSVPPLQTGQTHTPRPESIGKTMRAA